MRNNNVKPGDIAPLDKFKKLGTIPVSRRTPEQRVKDLQDVSNWMRKRGKNDPASDPTGDFRKLDALLPRKKSQSPDDRSLAIEMALDWVRTSDVPTESDESIQPMAIVGTAPVTFRTPEDRKNDLVSAMNWLRNGKQESDDVDGNFTKIDKMLPVKPAQSTEDRARDLEGCLDWMRNNSVAPTALDDIEAFSKLGSVPTSHRTPEQREQDLDSAMNWLRNKGKDDETLDPSGDFRKLDTALPRKRGQNDESRAREIESALDWIRETRAGPAMESDIPAFKKAPSISACSRTPEQRSRDLQDVLNWVRGGRKPVNDPTGDFRKIDQVLPRRIGQSPEARARDIEAAM